MSKKKNICLYWAPGSFGDIINYLLINSGYTSIGDTPYVDNVGKVCYSFNDKFNILFNFSPEEQKPFYLKTWNAEELTKVSNLKNYIIGTHRIDQAKFIKETLKNQIQLPDLRSQRSSLFQSQPPSALPKASSCASRIQATAVQYWKTLLDPSRQSCAVAP